MTRIMILIWKAMLVGLLTLLASTANAKQTWLECNYTKTIKYDGTQNTKAEIYVFDSEHNTLSIYYDGILVPASDHVEVTESEIDVIYDALESILTIDRRTLKFGGETWVKFADTPREITETYNGICHIVTPRPIKKNKF